MGRPPRADEAGAIYHMLNRANRRAPMFLKDADYEAFEGIMAEALDRVRLRLFSYCLLQKQRHWVVSPDVDREMSRFGKWLGLTPTQRYHAHYHSTGEGHLYQGRFPSFPVPSDEHFLSICGYVERNASSARLCHAPDQWRFCSLWRWRFGSRQEKAILSPWPIPRPPNWVEWVTEPLTDKELKQLPLSIQRDAPCGEETWVESTSRRLGLESTIRSRGRPKKLPKQPLRYLTPFPLQYLLHYHK